MTDEEPSAEMKELCLQAADSNLCPDCGEKLTEIDVCTKTLVFCLPCFFKSTTQRLMEYPVHGVTTGRLSMRASGELFEASKNLAIKLGVPVTVDRVHDSFLVQFEKP